MFYRFYSGTCFVSEQVGDASKLFRYGASPHHRPRDFGIFLNHPTENHLSHIQVDTQTALKKKKGKDKIKQYVRTRGFLAPTYTTIKHNYTEDMQENLKSHLMGTM